MWSKQYTRRNKQLGESVVWRQGRKNHPGRAEKGKRILKNKESLRNILDNMHHNNICIVGIPEGEECEQGIEDQFKDIMTKNFPNHIKGKDTQA